jgi:4-amino-4-deoxy-L-arabinose transferase-like glycosyltransferase
MRVGLLAATAVAGVLRFLWLGSVPVALYCDEALHGYEAWSLLTTGADRRGVFLPFVFDVFGIGWSEPLYIYLTVPAIALLGVTPLAARCVAAVAGTLAVPVAGLMTEALLRPASGETAGPISEKAARRAGLAAAWIMTASPWAFHFSRIGFQASLLPLWLGAAFWLAASALRRGPGPRRTGMLAAGAASLALTLYTYPAARVTAPLLAAAFAWTHRGSLRRDLRSALAAGGVLAALALPMAGFSLSERGMRRFGDVAVTSREAGPVTAAGRVAANYLSYWSPRFLLLEGDSNHRHGVRGHGVLHPHEAVLLLAGLAACVGWRKYPGARFLLWWMALFPVAAAFTIDPRHAVRSLMALPGLYALAGCGVAAMASWWSRGAAGRPWMRRGSMPAAALAGALALGSCGLYLRDYFVSWPVASAPAFQYGLRETYDYVESVAAGHDSVYITRNEDHPWIQLLFHRRIPPAEFQRHQLTRTPYLFGEEVFYKGDRIPGRRNPIFVWKPFEVPETGVETRRIVRYPDGSPAFVIAW